MKLLLSGPPLELMSDLESLSLSAEIIDTPSVYELLGPHRRTLRDVEISHMFGPIIACDVTCIGMHGPGSLLELERLERLVAPECYFRHITDSRSQSQSPSDACPKSMTLREAFIIWQDVALPIDPTVASLDASRDSLHSLTCRRPGANADLIETLAGRFTNLRTLIINGFVGSEAESDVPADVTMVSV